MKKIATTLLILTTFLLQGMAQVKYLDIYQNGRITRTFATTDVDSINVSGNESDRMVNFFRGASLVNSLAVTSVDSIKVFRSNEEPLVYMGIVGFNQELYTKPIDVLATSTASQFKTFVSTLPRKDGTLLYYAVDDALDMLEAYNFPTALGSVNLVTFTDGLDQGSLMMNPAYSTEQQYLNSVSQRISGMKVRGLPLTAYSLGLRGSDVTDYPMFRNNLIRLASSSDKATEAGSMAEVQSRLQEIADRIISISTRQSITAKIPGTSNGAQICFTFDGETPANSSMYITGTFNLSDYTLRNVTYHGVRGESSVVQGTREGIFLTFTFSELQREDGNGLIPTAQIRQYNKAATSSTWQVNSEFSSANNTQTTTTHTGAAIVLVLDCSNSLGTQFSNMQGYVQDFIGRVANNTASYTLAAPDNVTAELDDETFQISVCWNAVKHAESYDVYRSGSSSGSYTKVAGGLSATEWTDDSPLQGSNYYRVVAVGHGLTSSQSKSSNKVSYSIEAPANVKATLNGQNFTVNVSWDASPYAESYNIYRSNSSSGSYTLVAMGITATSWTDDSPLSGSNYYKVVAVGHGLTSTYSNASNAADNAIAAPTNVKAVLDEVTFTVNVSWEASTYAESYNIYRSSNSSGNYTLVAMDIISTEWTDEAPLQGSNYYKVYAFGHGMTSVASTTTNMVKVNYIPDAPQNVVAVLDDNNFTISVSWDAVPRVDGYAVYRSNSKTGTFTKIAENVTTNSWADNAPLAGANYYRVCAFRRGYTSEVSNTTNLVNYVLSAPANATAVLDDNDFVVRVTWDAVPHAERYSITRSNRSSGTFTKVAEDIMTTTWTDASPLPGNNCYRVYAYGYGLVSPASNTTKVVDYALSAPANVIAVLDEVNTVVDISWDEVKHAESYTIYRSGSSTGNFEKVAEGITSTSWTDEQPKYSNFYKVCAVGYGLTSEMSAVSAEVPIPNRNYEVNGITFKMILVSGGTFQMGKSADGNNVKPVHSVTLSDYYIGETEVTQELWQAVMGSNPSYFKGNKLPVEEVSWNDCQTFITKLNELTGQNFRLPTDAEWEFAAKGGTKSKGYTYSGSNTVGDVAWYYSNSSSKTHEVATKAPNELGIYDMSGNVWEWCQDWYGSYSSSPQTNPTGPSSGSNRVYRGGSGCSNAARCRTACRIYSNPTTSSYYIGLRLAQ